MMFKDFLAKAGEYDISSPDMSATQYTIREIPGELYTIISVDEMEATPALKQDQIRRGFEGRIYTMSRVIEGTRKRPAQTLAIRTKRGEFQTLF